jgi:hypothetical protein
VAAGHPAPDGGDGLGADAAVPQGPEFLPSLIPG